MAPDVYFNSCYSVGNGDSCNTYVNSNGDSCNTFTNSDRDRYGHTGHTESDCNGYPDPDNNADSDRYTVAYDRKDHRGQYLCFQGPDGKVSSA